MLTTSPRTHNQYEKSGLKISLCNTLQQIAAHCKTLQHTPIWAKTIPGCEEKDKTHSNRPSRDSQLLYPAPLFSCSTKAVIFFFALMKKYVHVLQCVAVCCSLLQSVAVCCSVLHEGCYFFLRTYEYIYTYTYIAITSYIRCLYFRAPRRLSFLLAHS